MRNQTSDVRFISESLEVVGETSDFAGSMETASLLRVAAVCGIRLVKVVCDSLCDIYSLQKIQIEVARIDGIGTLFASNK